MAVPKEASCRLDSNFHCGSTGWPALLLPPVSWALVRTSLRSVTKKIKLRTGANWKGIVLLVSEWKNLACHPAGSVFQKGDMGMYPSSHGHIPGVSSENCQKKKRWTRDWEANEGSDLGQNAQSHSVLWYKHHYALQAHILEQSEQIWVMGLWGKGAPHQGMNLSTWRSPKPRRQQNPWQELLTCNERIC